MTLYDRLKADNTRILSSDDMIELKLTNSSGDSFTARGRVTNPGLSFNPQGQPVAGQKISVVFNIDTFMSIISPEDVEIGGRGWKAEFTNAVGDNVVGSFNLVLVNRTFGHVEVTLTRDK